MFICLKKCVCFFLNYKIYRESLKRNEINFKKENLKFTKKFRNLAAQRRT